VRRDGGRAGTMGGSEVGAVAAGTARTLACSGHSSLQPHLVSHVFNNYDEEEDPSNTL
jgi:hypothetical protein